MSNKNIKWMGRTLLVGTVVMSMNAVAHYAPVWSDSAGKVVHDGSGDCLRTINWKGTGCGEAPAPAPVKKKVAPVVAAPVVAEPPARKPFSLSSGAAFATGGSDLSAEGKAAIKGFTDKLQGHEVTKIVVEGYTDDRGPAAFNQDLSEKRANAVREEMINNGVDASLITAIGHGENNPVADNATREGRAKNRRVTVTVEGLK